ncbi:hypothetical protein SCUCBS95973_005775 [Sporothrix curviconia]|uniref:Rhodopsin domain-containing protein n=1 Tax=Sporothrix curviconia TaxID=1260050 RepID=A0ABP0BZR9_9PEZI
MDDSLETRGPYINASVWTLQTLAGLFLGLRIYCKIFRHRGLWFDDYFLISAWVLLAVSAASTSRNVALGFGHHFGDFPNDNLEKYGIFSILSGFFSILSAVCSKTSFAITLLRLTDGWLKRVIWAIIISMNILMPLSALFLFVSCNPPAKSWNKALPGKCWPNNVSVIYGIVVGAYSSGCDLALALLPWRILMQFRMYRREKIGVALAMSMGVFACGTGIAKCVMLPLLGSSDFTYDGAPFVVWGFAECAVSIMAASIPSLRALVNEIRGAPQFIQRMVPSLRISPTHAPSKRPDDISDATTVSTPGLGIYDTFSNPPAYNQPGDNNNNNNNSNERSSVGLSFPASGSAAMSSPRHQSSDKSMSILDKSGLSRAEVVVEEYTEAGDPVGEQDIEMGTRRHSYNMQNVAG